MDLPVCVHHPGHRLRVGAEVGSRDVPVDRDEMLNAGRVPSRQTVELAHAQRAGVALDAALGAAERDIDQRGLPGHERREGADLFLISLRVVPHASLVRSPHAVVLDPVAIEHFERSVVHPDRDRDVQLPPRASEQAADAVSQSQTLGGPIEEYVYPVECGLR